jgi:hypothetical protein
LALFQKIDPTKNLARDTEVAVSTRDKIRARLGEAETAISDATAAANGLALSGASDEQLDRAEALLRARIDRQSTLRAALDQSDTHVAKCEANLAGAVDQKQRGETVGEVTAIETEVKSAAQQFLAGASRLALITGTAGAFIPEMNALNTLCERVKGHLPDNVGLMAKLLNDYSGSVQRGEAPATLPKPQAVAKHVNPAPAPSTVRLFAMRPIKWRAGNGLQIVGQKFQDCELPPATAKKALALKACVPVDDALARQHRGTVAGHPDAKLAFDLDAEPGVVATAVDRGGPVQMRVAR